MSLKIIRLYANRDAAGGYTDVYTSIDDCLRDHPDDVVRGGYGVLDEAEGHLAQASDDFYFAEEDAQEFIDQRNSATSGVENVHTCQMVAGCTESVTHLDQDGFVYCTDHGLQRRIYQPCRKLRPHELNRLKRGDQVTKY